MQNEQNRHCQFTKIYQMAPWQLPTVATQGLKVFIKKLIQAPNLPTSGDQAFS